MCHFLNALLAVLSRFLFAVHGVVTVWRVVAVKGEPLYWLLLTGVALLGVEMAVTLKCTRNAEWKWFSPMVFLYLSTVIPSIWFLELSLLQSKLPVNNSSGPELHLLAHIPITVDIVELEPENWVAGLEQTMLIVLVLGRWLMPKGDMSRDQLSQLLMVYVGLGADILDIFDTFREPEVQTKRVVVVVGLALFSWALMQFPLVLTQTRAPQKGDGGGRPRCPGVTSSLASFCSSEVWSLLLTVGLQDGPFLLYRLYLMIQEQVLNQLMIFFTCKNILIVLLEIYRILVVQCEPGSEGCAALVIRWRTRTGIREDVRTEACSGEQSCQTEMERNARCFGDIPPLPIKARNSLRVHKDRRMFERTAEVSSMLAPAGNEEQLQKREAIQSEVFVALPCICVCQIAALHLLC
ncbi:transmembrane protein 26-like [Sphaeramia orbicularis]|uniref:transmembrane protein 26-like n=1 Tax=Sphaeramia orbicularis TaxID=375764 RepID=UPI00117BF0FA|nr:transmembrane protein 26-like [Sphaeramia orbicularis]XP_029994706.1 transmembrane protein 26-like [Sphaeramia orbicularis]